MRFPIERVQASLDAGGHLPLDKQLIDAARTDNVDQLLEVFSDGGNFDINYQDG